MLRVGGAIACADVERHYLWRDGSGRSQTYSGYGPDDSRPESGTVIAAWPVARSAVSINELKLDGKGQKVEGESAANLSGWR